MSSNDHKRAVLRAWRALRTSAGPVSAAKVRAAVAALHRTTPTCAGCHWHVIENGWLCCHGDHRVRMRNGMPPPESTTRRCIRPPAATADESFKLWLKPASRDFPQPRRATRKRHSARTA